MQEKTISHLKTDGSSAVFFLEHPSVITMGKNDSDSQLSLLKGGAPVVQSSRGGKMTAHMPGQLVIYPLLSLDAFKLTPKNYVGLLEKCVTQLLATYKLKATIDSQNPGVWVDKDKIAAVGIQFKERYSLHGIAINVCNDLTLFSSFVPCGIEGRGVTSLKNQGIGDSIATVMARFAEILALELHVKLPPIQNLKDLQKWLAESKI